MAKINLDNVRGLSTFSVLADKEYENGAIVGLGDLVEGEVNMYHPVAHAEGEAMYLVSTPEIDRSNKSSSIDHTNEEGDVMRVHLLETGDIFTIEQVVADANTTAAGQLVEIEKTKIGADARDAVSFRVQ